ncbi:ribosomal L28e protein family [Actinidia rufa]|uniref:Ribosomal L28e protein family n=1 Tax=Actinidia rufa TaxID=165716 RepID=A0A7J0GBD8_9ERIC|nr:ribosomal L28e protein family [Actinidia rufa]
MATVPGPLIWEIVKKNNSFLVKEFGNGTASVQFSKESNNLYNLNSYKHSERERVATVSHGYLLPQHEGKIVFSLPRGGCVTTDGGTPVRPISGCGWIWSPIGGEIKESKMVAKPGRWREEGEEIREMAKSEAISGRQTGCKGKRTGVGKGLANKKTVTIQPGGKDQSVLFATTKTKKQGKPASLLHKSVMKKEFRRMAKAVKNQVADNYYRPDLKNAALARLSAVQRSLKVSKSGVKKRNRQAC